MLITNPKATNFVGWAPGNLTDYMEEQANLTK